MTSPLRRKRQITVPNTPPEKAPNASPGNWLAEIRDFCDVWKFCCWTGLVVAGLAIVSAMSKFAAADDSTSAAYSTGKMGGRLKWMPQHSQSVNVDPEVKPVQYSEPRPLRTAQVQMLKPPSSGAFIDPFGDKQKQDASSPAPIDKQNDATYGMPSEPAKQDVPKSTLDYPVGSRPSSDLEKPYVAPGGLMPPKSGGPNGRQSQLEESMIAKQHEFNEKCPSPKDLKPIRELNTNIVPSEGDLPRDCPLGNSTFAGRSFAAITYSWTASGLCHKPLYFEDVQLERYGHMAGPFVQPLASGAHFFLTFPILPYKMGLELPNECMYTLGYYRPGNCAPYLFDPLPLSVRGALFEGGAWVAAPFLIP